MLTTFEVLKVELHLAKVLANTMGKGHISWIKERSAGFFAKC
jgi:hypothetical protein